MRDRGSQPPFPPRSADPLATVGQVIIRAVERHDAEAIAAIYNEAVVSSVATMDLRPRTLEEQQAWIDERSGALPALVAVIDGTVAGFAAVSPHRSRPAYRTSVEDSIYIDGGHRGAGVGRALLAALLEATAEAGFHAVFARCVAGGADASIALHQALGFEVVGTEREVGRKFGRWHDVVVLQKLLGT